MNTIEDAAIDYSIDVVIDSYVTNKVEKAFIKGAEFAQKWIDINDELPPLNKHIIIKCATGGGEYFYSTSYLNSKLQAIEILTLNLQYWRLIEFE